MWRWQVQDVRTGYDYVELRVTFKEDLHPFYPPTIALVRPRLHGRCLAKRDRSHVLAALCGCVVGAWQE